MKEETNIKQRKIEKEKKIKMKRKYKDKPRGTKINRKKVKIK
jgi:hypothetical protein